MNEILNPAIPLFNCGKIAFTGQIVYVFFVTGSDIPFIMTSPLRGSIDFTLSLVLLVIIDWYVVFCA